MSAVSSNRSFPANSKLSFRLPMLAAASLGSWSQVALAQTLLTVSQDAMVVSTLDTNYNTGQFRGILASETGTPDYIGGWMMFDVSTLQGQAIANVTLELTAFYNHSSTPISHRVFSSTVDSWSENTITGINQPAESTLTSLASFTSASGNGVYRWDVTSAFLAGGAGADNGVLSLLVRPDAFPNGVIRGPHFYSREGGGTPAQLRVTFVPTPSAAAFFGLGGLLASRRRR